MGRLRVGGTAPRPRVTIGAPVVAGGRLAYATHGLGDEGLGDEATLWYASDDLPEPSGPDMDAAAVALMPMARREGVDLHLRGRVARSRLAALEELQDVWGAWPADKWDPASITADEVRDDVPCTGRRGILAFSGGLDAVYSLVAHRAGLLGHRSVPTVRTMFIRRLEFSMVRRDDIERAVAAARAISEEVGAPFTTVETNWRATFSASYPMDHMLGIAGALRVMARPGERLLTSSGAQYGREVVPHGGNVITDRLLGQDAHPVEPTGYGLHRIDKCRAVAHLDSVREGLRVCWQPEAPGENCRTCEKCVRTKLNLLAAGVGEIPALGALDVEDIATIPLKNEIARRNLGVLLDYESELGPTIAQAVRDRLGLP